MKSVLAFSLAFLPLLSHAVVATTSQIAPGAADTAFTFVGSMSGASAVAISAYEVLTAGHVGAGNFVLGGVTYPMASTDMAPMVSKIATDLRIVHLASALPGWYAIANSVASKATLTMVGFGGTGIVNDEGTGYELESGGLRRSGSNSLDSKATVAERGPSLRALLSKAGQAALAGGDSGGGWFSSGKLVGISDFTYSKDSKKPAYGFAKKAYFGSGAIDLTNKSLQSWLASETAKSRSLVRVGPQAVPEPGSYIALALGMGAMFVRKKR